jgi:hypothetical protein
MPDQYEPDEPAEQYDPNDPEGLLTETTSVRPYALTGGRTRTEAGLFPIEALVSAIGRPGAHQLSAEKSRIIDMAMAQYLSIAELSAHLKLPVGVVRVLVGDLVEEGHARVHGAAASNFDPASSLGVLESVLDGISAL